MVDVTEAELLADLIKAARLFLSDDDIKKCITVDKEKSLLEEASVASSPATTYALNYAEILKRNGVLVDVEAAMIAYTSGTVIDVELFSGDLLRAHKLYLFGLAVAERCFQRE